MLRDNLKKARIDKGMSQEQLAARLSVVRQTVSKWEKGLSVPDAETLVNLSEVLGVPVNQLLGEPTQESAERGGIAEELARLNELMALKIQRQRSFAQKVKAGLLVALAVLALMAIYPRWNEIWYEFGRSVFKLFNR